MTWRRALRWTARLVGATLVAWSVRAVLASPASADNCGTFLDCFNQSNAAAEAGFGLVLLTGLSLLLDFTPVVGSIKGGIEGITGRDLLTGEQLAAWERAIGWVPYAGKAGDVLGLGGVLGRGVRGLDDLAGVAGRGDEVVDGLRHADDLPGLPGRRVRDETAALHRDGATIGHPPARQQRIDDLVAEYNRAGTPAHRRGRISEELGEHGAASVLERLSGRDVPLLRGGADQDFADFADLFEAGRPWPGAATFRGNRVTNVVWFDGDTLHVIEAKGGSGRYIDRNSNLRPGRIAQTDPDYPLDVAADMMDSSVADGRRSIGEIITDAYQDRQVQYFSVRTGNRDAILEGSPTTWIEHLFKQ